MNTKNILVTGAGGFIGSHLIELLVSRGFSVTAFLHYNANYYKGNLEDIEDLKQNKNLKYYYGDITDYESIQNIINTEAFQYIFHLAALNSIPYSYNVSEMFLNTNAKGTLNLLQALKQKKSTIEKIIITSTSEVYGTAQLVPITENHSINPQSPYAASKVASDAFALAFKKSFDLPIIILRPFNTYGPRQSLRAIVPTIITQLLKGSLMLGSLLPTRDLVYVKDTAKGFLKIAETIDDPFSFDNAIHIATGKEISIKDLVSLISSQMKDYCESFAMTIDKDRIRPEKSEVLRLCGSNHLLKTMTDWIPEISLEEGIQETIQWYLKNIHKYEHLMGYIK